MPLRPVNPAFPPRPPPQILLSSSTRTFSCAKAKRDFGYKPKVDMDEALRRTIEFFPHLRNDAPGKKTK